ncbi:MAG: hypothetical protein WCO45_13200 [Pseudanabaena sp. ELA607]|jgi:hypothetical protein
MPKSITKIILMVLSITGAVSFGAINQLDLHPSVQIYLLLLVAQSLVAAVIFWRKKNSD